MALELRFLGKRLEYYQREHDWNGATVYVYTPENCNSKLGEAFFITFLDREELRFSLFKDEKHFNGLRVNVCIDLYLGENQRCFRNQDMLFGEIKDYLKYLFDMLETEAFTSINTSSTSLTKPGTIFNSQIYNDFAKMVKY